MTNNSPLLANDGYDYIPISVKKGTKIHNILEKSLPLKGVECFYGTAVWYKVPKSEFEKEELQRMNRTIKFKAKRLDNGEWVKGNLRTSKSDNAMIIPIEYSGTFPVDPYTICQFTGLTDREGNEVWEGDIIKNHDFPFEKRTVTWANCLSCFIPIDENGGQDGHLFSYLVLFKKWTVVGNKFDKEE